MNPFHSTTATDELTAENAVKLFSNVFSEFNILLNPGHAFLNGARGSGKTMMFRLMQPDCQQIMIHCPFKELKFIAFYIGIKDTHLRKTDLDFLKNRHAETLLNEHLLVSHFSAKIFMQISNIDFINDNNSFNQTKDLFDNLFIPLIEEAGWVKPVGFSNDFKSTKDVFFKMALIVDGIVRNFSEFERNIISNISNLSYKGVVLTYSNFLFPILNRMKALPCFPKQSPVYLMVDDADNLNQIQKMILNTWISNRHITLICFKISTQLNYKLFKTLNGNRIETPHDYSEINIADRYTTSSRSFYKDRVIEVVKKRLEIAGLTNTNPYDYFPTDFEQEQQIKNIFVKLKNEQLAAGKSEKQAYDFAYRYARPNFIRDILQGNRNTYSYAGFEQLVHISSGNMRQFIEPARNMYDTMLIKLKEESNDTTGTFIYHSIQDEVIRKYSSDEFFGEFKKLLESTDESLKIEEKRAVDADGKRVKELLQERMTIENLRNLIEILGNMFANILLSDASERRVFSIALQEEPSKELNKIINLGIELGYFQMYVIGNKYGTGKAKLLILNRVLAPHFGLDPSSFAGYKFVYSENIEKAIPYPFAIIKKIKAKGVDEILDSSQPSLFKDKNNEND